MDLAAQGLGAKEWNNSLKTKLSLLPEKLFRIRMSRHFGMKMLTMTNLSTECLIQLPKLGYDAPPFNQILKQNAKREMRLRLGKVTVADVLAAQPVTTNLLKFMREIGRASCREGVDTWGAAVAIEKMEREAEV